MVHAFALLARLPVLPFQPDWRADIVPADYVGRAIVEIHQREKPSHDVYHLSAGEGSLTYCEIADHVRTRLGARKTRFVPELGAPFGATVQALARTPRSWGVARGASMMQAFLPYLVFNTVFDNSRIRRELGETPAPFVDYAYPLLRFALDGGFRYPYRPWPATAPLDEVA
jgi:nucleoside-diphosphate-sugar epimerase